MIAELLATWFGCGYAPKAPGTMGALGALIPAILAWSYLPVQPWHFALLAILATPVGIWSADAVARNKGLKDPQIVVIDEVLGVWLALAGATVLNWKSFLGAFALFRLFDIWKPQPVRKLEQLGGGLGIVADDLMAGVYAALVLFTAGWFNLY